MQELHLLSIDSKHILFTSSQRHNLNLGFCVKFSRLELWIFNPTWAGFFENLKAGEALQNGICQKL